MHPVAVLGHREFFLTCIPPPQLFEQDDQALQEGSVFSKFGVGVDNMFVRQESGQ